MKPPKQPSLLPSDRELRNPRIQTARTIIAIAIAAGAILLFLQHATPRVQRGSVHAPALSRTETDCLFLFASLLLTYQVFADIRSGVTNIGAFTDLYPYTRSSDPVGYWILIALHGALAAGSFIALAGDVLGFWNISG